MEAVIPDPSLSVRQGGIAPLGEERQAYLYQSVETFAKKNKINLDKPLHDLSLTARNLLLFGTPDAGKLEVVPSDDGASGSLYEHSVYEGIVPMLQRWFTHGNSTEALHEWVVKFMQQKDCPACEGQRLRKESRWFLIQKKNIAELSKMDLSALQEWLTAASGKLSVKQQKIARDILKEIQERLQFLLDVGLHYLTIERPTRTLSGGESQRIRLATQIGSRLQGITYILDEPSIGLHQRDNQRLIKSLLNLRDIGNNVLVVEHDKDIMLAANYLVDIGPGAGRKGGNIVAAGTPEAILKSDSETASYLKGEKKIPIPKERRKGNGKWLELKGAKGNNLKNVTIQLPLGSLIVVSGVSGSGKSTLINETLYPLLSKHCYNSRVTPMPFQSISGLEHVDKVIEIDQSPIGRTPRSNPATYCGFFTEIRSLFAAVPEAKIRGYAPGRFSFNVKGGRCDVCEGGGMRVIEMNFLPDVYVHCEKCNGQRYNRETLEIRYKGKSISDVLNMTVDEAVEFFQPIGYLYRKIKVLQDVGLGYIALSGYSPFTAGVESTGEQRKYCVDH